MIEPASRSRLLAKTPVRFSSLASGIRSDWLRRRQWRRRGLPLTVAGNCGGGKRSMPSTPLLQWKFNEEGTSDGDPRFDAGGKTLRKQKKPASGSQPAPSARRLAAGMWQLRLPKVVGGGKKRSNLEINCGQLHLSSDNSGNCFNAQPDTNEDFISLPAFKNRRNGVSHKLEASASLLPSSTERASKLDLGYSKVSKDAFNLYDNLKLFEDQKADKSSIVSALRSELALARSKVSKLESERLSFKKKLDHFMRKIEEKSAWRRREHEKMRSVIDAMTEDLDREKKNGQRLEIMNNMLVNELTEAKLSAKQLLQEYEKERKARELMEEVCNDLAKEIGDDKAEVEALKMESVKTREEVEEERKMLQMAEVWREERVQMKLIDAKLALEDKYSKLSKLQREIESFLNLRSGNNYDVFETKRAKALKEAIGSVKAHDMNELSYQPPPASDGLLSIFEELQPRDQGNVKETEQCHVSSTPVVNEVLENTMKKYNLMFYRNCDQGEEDSGWETASHVEEEDSCKSPDGSEPSVSGVCVESRASASGAYCDNHRVDEKQFSEISEVCSITPRQSRKRGSSLSRLWKSSRASNAEDFKKVSFVSSNGRLCNGRSFNATILPARKSAETVFSSPNVVGSGMKDPVEWPQSTKKQSLKAKLMEARIQKVQLRQVLKQKI